MHALQSCGRESIFDDIAYTMSVALHNATLQFYTTHPAFQQDRKVFYTNLVEIYPLKNNLESFREGLTALRNARKWAKKQHETIIAQANERCPDRPRSDFPVSELEATTMDLFRSFHNSNDTTEDPLRSSENSTATLAGDSQSTDEIAKSGVTTSKKRKSAAIEKKKRTKRAKK